MNPDIDLITSPFKFLDAFQKQDQDAFFGREREIEQLYNLVSRSRIVIVYGTSGTGKTSLVQCGLANCFDPSDWFSLYIRRGNNLICSIVEILKDNKVIDKTYDCTNVCIDQLIEALIQLVKLKLRPIYFIFDQFEELLILGGETEQGITIELIKQIIANERLTCCNLIFNIRQKYIGSLENIAEQIPSFMDTRMHLEPMHKETVKNVIIQLCEKYNIVFENSESIDIIIDTLHEKQGVSLPYLQVYLDQFWRMDYIRTYPKGYDGSEKHPPLEFTQQEIEEFGKMKDVLQRFLNEQTIQIKRKVENLDGYYPELLDKILDALVTSEGTKAPLEIIYDNDMIRITPSSPEFFHDIPSELLSEILKELDLKRILREEKKHFELAHDKLAELIYQKRIQENQHKLEVMQEIESSRKQFATSKTYLSDKQLSKFQDILPQINFDDETANFLEKSKSFIKRKKISQIAIPSIILFVFVVWLGVHLYNSKLKNTYYLQLHATNFFDKTLDTIADKKLALQLAHYVYNSNTDSTYQAPLKDKYYKLLQSQELQAMLSAMSKSISLSILQNGDFDMSDNGDFMAVKTTADDENFGDYNIYDGKGNIIKTFKRSFRKKVNYVYFTNKADVLLVAFSDITKRNKATLDTVSIYSNYPNQICLYNCRTKKLVYLSNNKTVLELPKGIFLYPKNRLFNYRNRSSSYLIRFTDANNLIIPLLELDERNHFFGKVWIFHDSTKFISIPNNNTVGISNDGKLVITGYSIDGNHSMVEIRSEMRLTNRLKDIVFADFTGKDSVFFIKKNTLNFLSPKRNLITRLYKIPADIQYGYTGGDEQFAILRPIRTGFYLYNLKQNRYQLFDEDLSGSSFTKQTFISSASRIFGADTIYKRDFYGHIINAIGIPLGISKALYNEKKDNLLVLDKKNKLYLFNDSLKVKATYQLSANDIFGFSKNGSVIYYVRDSSLNVLNNDQKMINLGNQSDADRWIQLVLSRMKPLNKETLKRYNLTEKAN